MEILIIDSSKYWPEFVSKETRSNDDFLYSDALKEMIFIFFFLFF